MKHLALVLLLVGCSSPATTTVYEIVVPDAAPVETADAGPDVAPTPDAGNDASPEAAPACSAPGHDMAIDQTQPLATLVLYDDATTCQTACGAGGPYHYTTTGGRIYAQGCTQRTNATGQPTWDFCCPKLPCFRLSSLDAQCKTQTANYAPNGYSCEGPEGQEPSAGAGCSLVSGTQYCCP